MNKTEYNKKYRKENKEILKFRKQIKYNSSKWRPLSDIWVYIRNKYKITSKNIEYMKLYMQEKRKRQLEERLYNLRLA